VADGLGTDLDVLARQFRLHLHRGISYLAPPHLIRSIGDLVRLAVTERDRRLTPALTRVVQNVILSPLQRDRGTLHYYNPTVAMG
jgi:hypothetical protein